MTRQIVPTSRAHSRQEAVVKDSETTNAKVKRNADVRAGVFLSIAFVCGVLNNKQVIFSWFARKLNQSDLLNIITLTTTLVGVFSWCKDRCIDFYFTQRRRLRYVDEIPDIKTDVADIKAMLSRPWYKR